ncbi:MAG: glycosyltransferase family 2 protein [Rhodoferax sp.]
MPLITVAIPTLNRCNLLQRAVLSVLKQNIKDLDIIISDNGSIDGTREFLGKISDSRVTVLMAEKNEGMVPNWQRCLQHARGTYFLLMSDDDAFVCDDALSKLVSAFDDSEGGAIGGVFSAVLLERPSKMAMTRTKYAHCGVRAEDLVADFFNNKVSIFPCATLLRTADLTLVGAYNSFNATFAVDACAWISIALVRGRVVYIDEPLALYRIHASLSSSSIETTLRDLSATRELIEKNRSKLTTVGYRKIILALETAKARAPIGCIARQWKHNKQYNAGHALQDLLKNRELVFRGANIWFAFSHLLKSIQSRLTGIGLCSKNWQ